MRAVRPRCIGVVMAPVWDPHREMFDYTHPKRRRCRLSARYPLGAAMYCWHHYLKAVGKKRGMVPQLPTPQSVSGKKNDPSPS